MLEHQLRDFHEYVRRMRKQNLSGSERGLEAVLEHKQIMEAIAGKDADRAQELAALHMRNAYDNMIKTGLWTPMMKRRESMAKIQMTTPLVEMDGDEMTRILWQMIKDELLLPYIDLKTEYYDLGLEHRNETDDQVTIDCCQCNQKIRRCSKMCNNHTQRGANERI